MALGKAEYFRPLSWGLSFNNKMDFMEDMKEDNFRPLSWGLSFN